MKNMAELAAGICEACRREMENKAVEDYPVKQILQAYEHLLVKRPMFWGRYEYKGKEYGIEITVKEYKK
jgi:hypothetical protein